MSIIDRFHKENRETILFVTMVLIVLASCMFICFSQHIRIINAVLFVTFVFLHIYVVGLAVLQLLNIHVSYIISWSLAMGIGVGVVLVEFFALSAFGMQRVSPFIAAVITILSLFYIFWRKKTENDVCELAISDTGGIVLVFFLLVAMFYVVVCGAMNSVLPSESGNGVYYVDHLWWIGNNIAAVKGWPVENYRMNGTYMYYHVFSSIFVAQTYLITHINLVYLSLYFSSIFAALLFVLSAFSLFNLFIDNMIWVFWALAILFLTDGIWEYWFLKHTMFIVNGNEYAIPMGILAVLLCFIKDSDIRITRSLAVCFLIITLGLKGPVGVTILAGFGGVALHDLLSKRYKSGFIFGIGGIIAFVVTYLLVFVRFPIDFSTALSQESSQVISDGAFQTLSDFVNDGWVCSDYYIRLIGTPLNTAIFGRKICALIALAASIIQINPIVIIGVICAYIFRLMSRKANQYNELLISTTAMFIVGLFLLISFRQVGQSQRYFMYPVVVFLILVFALWLNDMAKETAVKRGIVYVAFLSLFAVGVFNCIKNNINDIRIGLSNIGIYTGELDIDDRFIVTNEKYEVYKWIDANLPSDSVLAVFNCEMGDTNHMMAGVFSGRELWNDDVYTDNYYYDEWVRRTELTHRFENGDNRVLQEMMQDGVTHILVYNDSNPYQILSDDVVSEVYRSGDLGIYELAAK